MPYRTLKFEIMPDGRLQSMESASGRAAVLLENCTTSSAELFVHNSAQIFGNLSVLDKSLARATNRENLKLEAPEYQGS
jgi:hypothetical protein